MTPAETRARALFSAAGLAGLFVVSCLAGVAYELLAARGDRP